MADQPLSLTTPDSPEPAAKFIEAIIAESRADADRVAGFLLKFGLAPSANSLIRVGKDLALFLGAFLRLAYWERLGMGIHLDAGLPLAKQAFAEAHRSVTENGTIPSAGDLWTSVWKLFVERFAWHGRGELGATVTLDPLDEDTALDALAELLWSRRHAKRGGNA